MTGWHNRSPSGAGGELGHSLAIGPHCPGLDHPPPHLAAGKILPHRKPLWLTPPLLTCRRSRPCNSHSQSRNHCRDRGRIAQVNYCWHRLITVGNLSLLFPSLPAEPPGSFIYSPFIGEYQSFQLAGGGLSPGQRYGS